MFVMLPIPNDLNRYAVGVFTPASGTAPAGFQPVYHNIDSYTAAKVCSFLNGGEFSVVADDCILRANEDAERLRRELEKTRDDAAKATTNDDPEPHL